MGADGGNYGHGESMRRAGMLGETVAGQVSAAYLTVGCVHSSAGGEGWRRQRAAMGARWA